MSNLNISFNLTMFGICYIFCMAIYVQTCSCEQHVVASNHKLVSLASFEVKLLSIIRKNRSCLPRQFLNFASSTWTDYENYGGEAASFVRFPVNQYRLIRRFILIWPAWKEELRKSDSSCHNAITLLLSRTDELSLGHGTIDRIPERDLLVAAKSLHRLQLYYSTKKTRISSQADTPTASQL